MVGMLVGPHSAPRRPRLVTSGTHPEMGLRRDVRRAPDNTFGVCSLRPRPRVGALVEESAGGRQDLSRTHLAMGRLPRKSPRKSPKRPATRDCSLGGSHPFPRSRPAARGSLSPRPEATEAGELPAPPVVPPGQPPPHSQRTSRRARRTLEESAAQGEGRRGARAGGSRSDSRDPGWGGSLTGAGP